MTDDAPTHDGFPAVPRPVSIGLNLALISVAVLTLLSWGILALHHADDRYNVGWVEGTRIALAQAADQGELYPPLYDGESFGGTRFMPVPVVLHQGIARLTGEFLTSGKLLAYVSTALLLGVMFWVMRRRAVPAPVALALMAGVLVTRPGLLAGTAPQGDALSVGLQLCAITLVASRSRTWATLGGAALSVAAIFAKLSAVWAPIAIGVWLLLRDRRRFLIFAGAFTGILIAVFLLFQLATDGRMIANLREVVFAGMSGSDRILGSPLRLVTLLHDVPLILILTPIALVGGAFSRDDGRISIYYISLLSSLAVLLAVLSDEGTLHNHLLDLAVLVLIVIGDVHARTEGVAGARSVPAMMLTVVLLWAMGTAYLFELRTPTRQAAAALLHGRIEPAYDSHPLSEVIHADDVVLSEDPYVPVSLGRTPVVLDAWALLRLGREHPEWTEDLARRIESREFDKIVLVFPISFRAWYSELHFGETIASAIRRSYELDREADGYHVYIPGQPSIDLEEVG